jgi:hypothetical protein
MMTGNSITFSGGWVTADIFEHDIQPLFKTPLPDGARIMFFFAERKRDLDRGCRLKAERGGTN